MPDVLVLHLKRFSYSRWVRDKVETRVHFPLDGLDVSPYVKGPMKDHGGAVFDCVAVRLRHYYIRDHTESWIMISVLFGSRMIHLNLLIFQKTSFIPRTSHTLHVSIQFQSLLHRETFSTYKPNAQS